MKTKKVNLVPADAGRVGRLAVEEKSDASSFDLIIGKWQEPGKRIVAKQADGFFCHQITPELLACSTLWKVQGW